MKKQIQITLDEEAFQEAKAQADMRHWEVEQWIEFSLRHAARCRTESGVWTNPNPPSVERLREVLKEARKHNNPNPDDIDRILREQVLQEIKETSRC